MSKVRNINFAFCPLRYSSIVVVSSRVWCKGEGVYFPSVPGQQPAFRFFFLSCATPPLVRSLSLLSIPRYFCRFSLSPLIRRVFVADFVSFRRFFYADFRHRELIRPWCLSIQFVAPFIGCWTDFELCRCVGRISWSEISFLSSWLIGKCWGSRDGRSDWDCSVLLYDLVYTRQFWLWFIMGVDCRCYDSSPSLFFM